MRIVPQRDNSLPSHNFKIKVISIEPVFDHCCKKRLGFSELGVVYGSDMVSYEIVCRRRKKMFDWHLVCQRYIKLWPTCDCGRGKANVSKVSEIMESVGRYTIRINVILWKSTICTMTDVQSTNLIHKTSTFMTHPPLINKSCNTLSRCYSRQFIPTHPCYE